MSGIHQLIARRRSPRAIDPERPVSAEHLALVLEAARWAPSCYGDEPWRFVVCDREREPAAWQRAAECLVAGNRGWAGRAPVLILSVASEVFRRNGKPNRWAQHDVGAASLNLLLQACALGLVAHAMGGFDAERARVAFELPPATTPLAMIALGHPGDPTLLEPPLRALEDAPRTRRPLGELAFAGRFGVAWS